MAGMTANRMESKRSSIPPWPGMTLPLSLTPAFRLKADSNKSPKVPNTTTIAAKQTHAHIGMWTRPKKGMLGNTTAAITVKKPAKKATLKKAAPKKSAETVTAEAGAPGAPAKEKKATKKAEPKKAAAGKPAPKKTPPTVILQSPFGGEITVDAVKTLVGEVDKVYVRIDQNKLYWVKGEESGAIDIW